MTPAKTLFPLLESHPGADGPDPLALELQSGLMVCAAVYAAVQLRLPDLLDQPKTVAQLAQESAAHEPTLLLLLRALASVGIFTEVEREAHCFAQTERSRLLCSDQQAPLVNLWGAPYQWRAWAHLTHTVRTGQPSLEVVYGEDISIWKYLDAHPKEAAIFQEGLVANARLILPVLLSCYDFSPFQSLADMGGGLGELSKAFLDAYPHLQMTLFDRAEVIEQARARGIAPQIRLCAGDFFLDPPPRLDAYLFKNVLMDWSDDDYQRILQRCAEVMAPHSYLLIVEPVLTDNTAFTRFFSLQMAMLMHAAHHRTLEEHRTLAQKAGLTLTAIVPLGLEQMLLELRLRSSVERGVQW